MPSRRFSSRGSLLSSLLLLSSMAGSALAQTPPFFEPSTSERLLATFDQNSTDPFFFVPGGVFAVNLTQSAPQIYLPANRTTLGPPTNSTLPATYLILMVDPDAPSPQNTSRGEILHWLQPGARLSRSTEPQTANDTAISLLSASDTGTEAVVPYQGPAPPSVGPHRYILLVFRQPEGGAANFSLPPDYEARRGGANRTLFNATDFVQQAQLGEPVAATFFLAGTQTEGNGSETYTGTDAAAGIGNSSLGGGGSGNNNATSNSTGGGTGGSGTASPSGSAPTDSGSGAERREKLGLGALIGALAGALWLIG